MKQAKVPFLLRVVRWIFPRLEKVSPSLASRFFNRLFFTPLNYPTPPKEREVAETAGIFYLTTGKKRIVCYQWGKGQYVLVMHGWAGRATQFRKFIEPLRAKGYAVIGFDGPAHGRSTGTRTDIFEFHDVLHKLVEKCGAPVAAIAHSFGGAAILYGAMNGLPFRKVITIASPTIGDEIIQTYLTATGSSWETGRRFKEFIVKKSGKSFDEFTTLHFIRHLPQEIELLLVHDDNDEEVGISQPLEVLKVYPKAELYRTKGLGHTRILKDDAVIAKCVTFIDQIRL